MTTGPELLRPTPWDARALGMDTYEVLSLSAEALEEAAKRKGHFTIRVEPRASRDLLQAHGFYYCDTLIEPYGDAGHLVLFKDERVSISREVPAETLRAIGHGAFYGRFHRDFNIPRRLADLRYDLWLEDLRAAGHVLGLMLEGEAVGFLGYEGNRMCLHAVGEKHRGRGLAKALWGAACTELFRMGHEELTSSISVSNVPVLNLYASIGFRFRKPLDIYHKLNP